MAVRSWLGTMRATAWLVGLALAAGSVAVLPPRVAASPARAAAPTEPEPMEIDRSPDAMEDAVDQARAADRTEAAATEIELPPGALDGTAGPDLTGREDPAILRPAGDDGVVVNPSVPNPGAVAVAPVESPRNPAFDDIPEVDDGAPDPELPPGGPTLSPEDLIAELRKASDSLADVTGPEDLEIVERAQSLDLSELEPGEEIEELRTVRSRTTLEEDGSLSTDLGTEPMFGEDASGELVEPDMTLAGARDGRFRPAAARRGVSFGATAGSSDLGSIWFDAGQALSWSLKGARPVPARKDGEVLRYEGVFEDVDLEMESSLSGIKETVVIHDPSAPRVYDFPLDLTGLRTEHADPYAPIVLVDAETGEQVGVIPSGFAVDAAHGEPDRSPDPGPVTYELVGSGADTVLRVSVDETWFTDPERVFPVRVDPSVVTDDYKFAGDTWINSTIPTMNASASPELSTGGGWGARRTYFARWDVGWLVAASILDAEYRTWNHHSFSCTETFFGVFRLTSGWNPATVNWNSRPSFGEALSAGNHAYGRSGCPANWIYTQMRATVQNWVDGKQPAYGVTGRISGNDNYDPNDRNPFKMFHSIEGPGSGGQILRIRWSPWRVKYGHVGQLTPPTATDPGSIKITVKNLAPTTWKATGTNKYRLGYHVWNAAGTQQIAFNGGQVDLPKDVKWGETVTVTVPLAPRAVGSYQYRFDMLQSNVGWFWYEGDHVDLRPYSVPVTIGNTAPRILSAQPGGMSDTRTPTLSVVGVNPDNYPAGSTLQYHFTICEDIEMTLGCVTRNWDASNKWTPTHLVWGRTYTWHAAVRETGTGGLTTDPDLKVPLTPTVVQPQVEKHFGSDPYAPQHGGVNPSIGNYVSTVTDVGVAGAGMKLDLSRTYNSMDQRVGAFGPGWSTFLDMSATSEAGDKLLISSPDGRQERYGHNPDGSWAGPAGNASILRDRPGGGWELERVDRTVYVFDDGGNLVSMRDGWGHTLSFTRTGGLVTKVTNETSGRSIDLGWAPDGPDAAQVLTEARTAPATPGGTVPTWQYGYDGTGRLAEVCAPGEPEAGAQCTTYGYHSASTTMNPNAFGKLRAITRQEGNVAVEIDYRLDGSVKWVENGEDDRWTFSDNDDQVEGTYHPINGWRAANQVTVASNATATFDVTGSGGVPNTGVQAVVVDVQVASYGYGYLQIFPSGTTAPPGVSNMDYRAGYWSNLQTPAVGADGNIKLTNNGTQDAVVTLDVVGWYAKAGVPGGSVFVPVPTTRLLDTRVSGQGPALGTGGTKTLTIAGAKDGLIPTEGVTGVVFDLQMVNPSELTDLTSYASGASRPAISTAITAAGIVDNLQATAVGSDGKVVIHNAKGTVHVVVDVVGYFADPAIHEGSVHRTITSHRLVDTRSADSQYPMPWPAGGVRPVTVLGEGPIPAQGVTGVVGEIQSLRPANTNTLRTGPSGAANGGTTFIAQANSAVGNAMYTGLGPNNAFDVWSEQANEIIIDITGYFTPVPRTAIVTDPRGNTVEYRYDSLGRLVSRTDEAGSSTAHTYNDAGFLASTVNEAGVSRTFTYDEEGRPVTERVAQLEQRDGELREVWGSTTYSGYKDEPGNPAVDGKLESVADGRSVDADDPTYRTTHGYNQLGQPTGTVGPGLPDAPDGVGATRTYADGTATHPACASSYGASPAGVVQSQTDAAGLTTVFCYQSNGDLAEALYPSGRIERYTYDDLGRITNKVEVSDSFPSGVESQWDYDLKGRVTSERSPAVTSLVTGRADGDTHQLETSSTYWPNGTTKRITVRDIQTDESRWTETTYDDADRPVSTLDNADRTTARSYDANGNLQTERGVDGATISYDYDDRNLLTTVTALDVVDDPIGAPGIERDAVMAAYGYDAAGRRIWEIDAEQTETRTIYRADGKVEHRSARHHQDTDPDTGLPTANERTVLLAGSEMDAAGNPVLTFEPTDVSVADGFDAAPLSSAWTTTGGWSVASGRLTSTAVGIAHRPGAADGQVGITAGPGEAARLVFRLVDAANYMQVSWSGGAVTAGQVIAGSENVLDRVDGIGVLAEGDRIEVAFTGSQLRVFRNGELVMQSRLAVESPGTGVGLSADAAGQTAAAVRFDAYKRIEASFDVYGRKIGSREDPGGADIQTTWDLWPDGRPRSVRRSHATDPVDVETTRFEYDPGSGLLSASEAVIDANEVARTEYVHDQRGLVVRQTLPEGGQVDSVYDAVGRLARVTGPARTVERYGQAAQNGARSSETYGYNAFGEHSYTVDAEGRRTVVTYDGRGFPTETALPPYTPPGGNPTNRVMSATYNAKGLPMTQTDVRGEVTEYTYNTLGLLIARREPAAGDDPAGVWRFQYDDMGRSLEEIDPEGAIIRQRWDDLGRVTGLEEVVRQPELAHHVSAVTVGDAGGALRTVTPEGVAITTAYDVAGRVMSSADVDGNTTTYGYDDLGRPAQVTLADGRVTRSHYDLVGNKVVEQVYAPGGVALLGEFRSSWDKEGRRVSSVTPRGVAGSYATTYEYDDAGQLTSMTTPVSPTHAVTQTWGYDESGHQTRYTDGRGNTTWKTYNALGLVEDEIDPPAGAQTSEADRRRRMTYDVAGNPTSQRSPGNVVVTGVYDELGRLITESGTGAQAATATRTFDYDRAGQLVMASTPAGQLTFSYDDRGLLLTAAGQAGSSGFVYDGDGRIVRRTDSAGVVDLTYDNRGLPESVTSSLAGTVSYEYDGVGQPTEVDYGNGTVRTYDYDDWGRVDLDRLTTGANVLYEADYGYDDDGNVVSKTITGTDVPSPGANAYTYDRASRVETWTGPGAPTQAYVWDDATNRIQAGATTAQFDAQNRLVSTSGPGGLLTNTWSANGTLDTQKVQRRIALVVPDASGVAGDAAVLLWALAASGHAVTLVDDNAATPAAESTDVVVISSDVDPGAIGAKYEDLAAPILNMAADTWQASGLVDAAPAADSGASATVADEQHQVAAGKTGTVALLDTAGSLRAAGAGSLGAGASSVWTTSSGAVVAAYDTGSATPGGSAPAPRVAYGAAAGALSSAGWDVVYAATAWADATTAELGTTNYDFDAFEQLAKVTAPDGSVSTYSYDPLGRRLTSPTGALSYAGTDIRPSSDGVNRFQPSVPGAAALDDMTDGGGLWAHADAHTDVVGTFAPGAASLTGAQSFDPWGQPLGSSGAPIPLGYQSERQDLPGGLIGMGVREYSPTTATFISHDPIYDPAVPNGYSYTPANPLSFTDPTGEAIPLVAVAAAAVAAAGAYLITTACQLTGCIDSLIDLGGRAVSGTVSGAKALGRTATSWCAWGVGPDCGGGKSMDGFRQLVESQLAASALAAATYLWDDAQLRSLRTRACGQCDPAAATAIDVPSYCIALGWNCPGTSGGGNSPGGSGNGGGWGLSAPRLLPPGPPVDSTIAKTTSYLDWWAKQIALGAAPTTVVTVDVAVNPNAVVPVPEIVLNLFSAVSTSVAAALIPDPGDAGADALEQAADVADCAYGVGEALTGSSEWWAATIGCLSTATPPGKPKPKGDSPPTKQAADDAKRLVECKANSFAGDTPVLMADGTTKPIEDVEIGDRVWATYPETGETGPRPVTDLIVGEGHKELVDIEVDGELITATDEHPFWVDDQGRWINAEDLEIGDLLLQPDGTTTDIDALIEHAHHQRVHNLTIGGFHTYYVLVGDEPVLVHNAGCSNADKLRANLEATGQYATGDYEPHHIVPTGAFKNRKAADQLAGAQAKLKSLGIDLNDAANGVYLPNGCHQSVGHTNDVFRELDSRLNNVSTAAGAKAVLRDVGQRLHYRCTGR